MHELSLAQALVDQVDDVLEGEGGGKVASVTVEIGAMSGVERDAFEFAFPLATEGTAMDGAKLIVCEVPLRIKCRSCGKESSPTPPMLLCSHCQSLDYEVLDGRDFLLKSLEVY